MYTNVEMAEAFVYKCVDRYNHERYVLKQPLSFDTVKLISMAKIVAGDLVSEITDTCLQFHGGFGFANEYDVERKFRETRLYQVAPISTNLILSYVAEHLLGLPRSF